MPDQRQSVTKMSELKVISICVRKLSRTNASKTVKLIIFYVIDFNQLGTFSPVTLKMKPLATEILTILLLYVF